jgi:hypothetical protein
MLRLIEELLIDPTSLSLEAQLLRRMQTYRNSGRLTRRTSLPFPKTKINLLTWSALKASLQSSLRKK